MAPNLLLSKLVAGLKLLLKMTQKKVIKMKKIKADLNKEFTFLKNVFSVMALPLQMKGMQTFYLIVYYDHCFYLTLL